MEYTATYSAEDNKLRLYASARVDDETFARLKALGFKWAPVQKLFVAPAWSPQREDLLIDLAGDIEPEFTTLAERAEAKAARLDALAEKRRADASALTKAARAISARFEFGQPILLGHHSQRRAQRDQEKMQNASRKAARAADAVNYWLYRADGVERHANYKIADRTRARRIKRLLTDLRDTQREINGAQRAISVWEQVEAQGAPPEMVAHLVGCGDRAISGPYGLYSKLDKGEITAAEVVALRLNSARATAESVNLQRWLEHTLNRLAYERSELGPVARFAGELTPVILQTFARTHGAEKPKATKTDYGFSLASPVPLPRHIADAREIELTADDWRDLMQSVGYEVELIERRPARKSAKTALPLINPTPEEAQRLQALWNARAVAPALLRGHYQPEKLASNPLRASQARVSAESKGSYSRIKTIAIDASGARVRPNPHAGFSAAQEYTAAHGVARIRIYTGSYELGGAYSVVLVADKPGKPLPIKWAEAEAEASAAMAEAQAAADAREADKRSVA